MNIKYAIRIIDYRPEHQPSIRRILQKIGWAEQYIFAAEQNMHHLSRDNKNHGVYIAISGRAVVGFLYVQYYGWNQLCQIQGLAVDVDMQRQGIASTLVARAEEFARSKKARGVYVDTPATNSAGRKFYEASGYQLGYIMPRYYETGLDGVTYQKFLDEV